MLFSHQSKVYRIPSEVLAEMMHSDEFEAEYRRIDAIRLEFEKNLATDCLFQGEYMVKMILGVTTGPVGVQMDPFFSRIFFALSNHEDLASWKVDLPANDLINHLHNEPGMGVNVDEGKMISCGDCYLHGQEYLLQAERAKTIMGSRNMPNADDMIFLVQFIHIDDNKALDGSDFEFVAVNPNGDMAPLDFQKVLLQAIDRVTAAMGDTPREPAEPTLPKPTHEVRRVLN